jgi:hypothetical protein
MRSRGKFVNDFQADGGKGYLPVEKVAGAMLTLA